MLFVVQAIGITELAQHTGLLTQFLFDLAVALPHDKRGVFGPVSLVVSDAGVRHKDQFERQCPFEVGRTFEREFVDVNEFVVAVVGEGLASEKVGVNAIVVSESLGEGLETVFVFEELR